MFFPLILLIGVADGSPDTVSIDSPSQCSFSVLPDTEGEVGLGSWSEFDTRDFVPSGGNCQACPVEPLEQGRILSALTLVLRIHPGGQQQGQESTVTKETELKASQRSRDGYSGPPPPSSSSSLCEQAKLHTKPCSVPGGWNASYEGSSLSGCTVPESGISKDCLPPVIRIHFENHCLGSHPLLDSVTEHVENRDV